MSALPQDQRYPNCETWSCGRDWQMSAKGQKRSSEPRIAMSAMPPESGQTQRWSVCPLNAIGRHVRLFEDSVGATNQRVGDSDAQRLGRLQIDVQLDFRGLLNRQFGGPVALENPPGIDAGQPV
jgi:hypothetical protein